MLESLLRNGRINKENSMRGFINVPFLFNTSLIIVLSMMAMTMAAEARPSWIKGSIEKIEKEVTSTHGDAQSERLDRKSVV